MADFDLDALTGRTYTVKIKGKELQASPPSLQQLLELMRYSQILQSVGGSEDKTELLETVTKIVDLVDVCIPGFKDSNPGMSQLIAAMQILVQLSTPEDIKALKENGIDVNNEKKIELDTLEKSQDSADSTQVTP